MTSKERINQRFAKDFNLPINIFRDDMFEYYHGLYDFWPEEEWVALNKEINEDYGGNMDAWLQHYADVRDKIIRTMEESQEYKSFNSQNMNGYAVPDEHKNLPDRNIYAEDCKGKTFISFDLKKANFQALKYAGVIKEGTYEDFIDKFDKSFYFKKSKYTRQVIFGKLNPKRTITVEHFMMSNVISICNTYFEKLKEVNGKIVAFKSNEIVYEVDSPIDGLTLRRYSEWIKDKLNFDVRVECIQIDFLPIVNYNGNKVSAYVRRNVNTGECVLKSTSTTFYPQVYKIWKNIDLEERDRMFYMDDQLAMFMYPLILNSIDPKDLPF